MSYVICRLCTGRRPIQPYSYQTVLLYAIHQLPSPEASLGLAFCSCVETKLALHHTDGLPETAPPAESLTSISRSRTDEIHDTNSNSSRLAGRSWDNFVPTFRKPPFLCTKWHNLAQCDSEAMWARHNHPRGLHPLEHQVNHIPSKSCSKRNAAMCAVLQKTSTLHIYQDTKNFI
jgi:hypothetical protein